MSRRPCRPFYAVALALGKATGQPVTLADLFAGEDAVQINDELTVERSALRAALSGTPVAGKTEPMRKLTEAMVNTTHTVIEPAIARRMVLASISARPTGGCARPSSSQPSGALSRWRTCGAKPSPKSATSGPGRTPSPNGAARFHGSLRQSYRRQSTMATIKRYQTAGGELWEVRYRQPNGITSRKRGFTTKRDAKVWASKVETSKAEGAYVSPARGRVTVADLSVGWLARQEQTLSPSYYRTISYALRQARRTQVGRRHR